MSTRAGSESTAVAAQDLASVADDIDAAFLASRTASRTDFTEFANQLGYLGKQLYIGYNFIESIVASTVFNGTDIARGEGVLRNVGQIAGDILLSAVFVAIDEISLASPDTYPIAITRPPTDRPAGWTDALAPNRYDPLIVPGGTTALQAAAADRPTPFLDGIDNAFIDGTVAFRTIVTPALNLLGPIGRQLYIGVNFAESVLASAVFNSTDVLRGEGLFRNIAEFGSDVGRSVLFVAIDEAANGREATPIAIERAPQGERPLRWEDADPPFEGPLTVPDRGPDDATEDSTGADRAETPTRPSLVSTWTAKAAERAEARAERAEQRAQKKAEREAARAHKAEKTDKTEKSDTAEKASDTE
ncbi:MAG: hypothetical protein PGN37_02790 [Mycobacterium kyogaense]|uniref:hypothetical protein n=1 Tax=Mycobacterium kyogaense TaxID=2212479 RepID=UPI002FFB0985